jgi:hypothetical protein
MADVETGHETIATEQQTASADLLVHIAPLNRGSLHVSLQHIRTSLLQMNPGIRAHVIFPDFDAPTSEPEKAAPGFSALDPIQVSSYAPPPNTQPLRWLPTVSVYTAAFKRAQECEARACLILGSELDSLQPAALTALATPVLEEKFDLALPLYSLETFEALLNSALLYPLTRALYAGRIRFPLSIDLACSTRFQQHLLTAAPRGNSAEQENALLWPATEAITNGFQIAQVEVGHRRFITPEPMDLSSILTLLVGSLFADVEARATYWQKMRPALTVPTLGSREWPQGEARSIETKPMIDSFKLGMANLQEIWSLVLPPNTLVALKKLDRMSPEEFHMPDAVWVRIVYDFALAYRLRNISRKHLLGALTPLYLGWVASYVREVILRGQAVAEERIQALALTFESDKPYLVSRWRWPDRFNP